MVKLLSLIAGFALAAASLGQLTRIPLGRPAVGFYLLDILVLVLLAGWLIAAKPEWRQIKKYSLTQSIFWFVLAGAVSLLLATPDFNLRQLITASLYLGRWLAYAALYWVFCWLFKKDKKFKRLWLKLMLVTGLMFAALGLVQYCLWPDLRPLTVLNWDDHYFRLASTFLDPNFAGIWLLLGLILAVNVKSWTAPVFYLALMLTYSRASYLSLVVSGLFLGLAHKKIKFLVFGCLVFIATLLLLPRPGGEGVNLARTASTVARLDNWQESIQLIKEKPIFGYGFNTLRYFKNEPVSHAGAGVDASLLFVWLTTGLVGLAAYLMLLKQLWRGGGIMLKASILAVFIHSFFNNTLFYAPIMFWLWVLAAEDSD